MSTVISFSDAFGMLFSVYFVLNIHYADDLSGLLTYTQRYDMHEFPEKKLQHSFRWMI